MSSWIASGYPMGTCGGTTTGTGGAGGSGGTTGTPDPLNANPTCTSNGSSAMNPGLACISCHATTGGEAPTFITLP